jgi:hypothetical protein
VSEKLATENIEKKNVSDESYFVLRWTMIKNSQWELPGRSGTFVRYSHLI